MVGVQLRLPLFDGGARSGRLLLASSREFQAQKALEDARNRVRVEVQEALLRSEAAAERVAVTAQSEEQARENQRIVALRYREGLASITDLLDADTALTAAALARAQAVHDLIVSRARLAWAMGK
jgi:outer membrane protein TolC